jgi:hypothetical protein
LPGKDFLFFGQLGVTRADQSPAQRMERPWSSHFCLRGHVDHLGHVPFVTRDRANGLAASLNRDLVGVHLLGALGANARKMPGKWPAARPENAGQRNRSAFARRMWESAGQIGPDAGQLPSKSISMPGNLPAAFDGA